MHRCCGAGDVALSHCEDLDSGSDADSLGGTSIKRTRIYSSADSLAQAREEALERHGLKGLSPPDQLYLLGSQARALASEGRFDESVARLRAARVLAPWVSWPLVMLSKIESEAGHPRAAQEPLEILLSRDFDQLPEARQERIDFGDDTYLRADHATRAGLFQRLGRLREDAGDAAGAAKAYERAAVESKASFFRLGARDGATSPSEQGPAR